MGKQGILADTDDGVPEGIPLASGAGAIATGPTSIGNFHVMGRTVLPGAFDVAGDRYSVINATLQPGEEYEAESGSMMYMSNQVKMSAAFGGWRMFSGEGVAKLKFRNEGSQPGQLGITPNMPMAIVFPWDTSQGTLNCKRGAWLGG